MSPSSYLGLKDRAIARTASRLVVRTLVAMLVIVGAVGGVIAAALYLTNTDRHWYSVLVAIIVGIGGAFGSWLLAALLSLFVEIADSLRVLARREAT